MRTIYGPFKTFRIFTVAKRGTLTPWIVHTSEMVEPDCTWRSADPVMTALGTTTFRLTR